MSGLNNCAVNFNPVESVLEPFWWDLHRQIDPPTPCSYPVPSTNESTTTTRAKPAFRRPCPLIAGTRDRTPTQVSPTIRPHHRTPDTEDASRFGLSLPFQTANGMSRELENVTSFVVLCDYFVGMARVTFRNGGDVDEALHSGDAIPCLSKACSLVGVPWVTKRDMRT